MRKATGKTQTRAEVLGQIEDSSKCSVSLVTSIPGQIFKLLFSFKIGTVYKHSYQTDYLLFQLPILQLLCLCPFYS